MLVSVAYVVAASFSACVNSISDEEGTSSGNIPISFSAQISSAVNTKALNNSFESGDQIGLYAMVTGNSIEETRYIDNLCLNFTDDQTLTPSKTVFYPEGDGTLDFVAYYPYQSDALASGESTLSISVNTDQSDSGNYSQSDFLTASTEEIESSNNAVTLTFKHRLSRIKIELIPQDESSLDELLQDAPKVTISGFYTQAEYSLLTDEVVSTSSPADISAYGEWQEEDGKLTGVEAIVIPQTITAGKQNIFIEWNGGIYTCPIDEFMLEDNTQRVIQIDMAASEDYMLTSLVGEIEEWKESSAQESTSSSQNIGEIHTSTLSFSNSYIYRAYYQGSAVAEICKEYLASDSPSIASQAIVAYPVKNDEADLTDGIVLSVIGKSDEKIHGGSVSWSTTNNTLTYTEGTSEPISKFYISSSQGIVTEKPDDALEVNLSSYTLRDVRNGIQETYPLVKIATQYWMGENLRATSYKDGTKLTLQKTFGEIGYFSAESDTYGTVYFYNGETLLGGEMAPEGYKIPSTSDWTKLKTYTTDDASLVKAGEWKEYESCTALNTTGFGAYPEGFWKTTGYAQESKVAAFWTMDDGEIASETVFFTYYDNGFVFDGTLSTETSAEGKYKTLSVRCLKE